MKYVQVAEVDGYLLLTIEISFAIEFALPLNGRMQALQQFYGS